MEDTLEIIKQADHLRDMEGRILKAIIMLEELGEEIKDDPLLSYDYPMILKKLAIFYFDIGENEKSKEYFNEALEVAKKDLNKIQKADIQTCLAFLELKTGSLEKAQEYIQKAWRYIGKKRGEKFTKVKVNTAVIFGHIYLEQGQYSKAKKKYNTALANAGLVNYAKGHAKGIVGLSNYYIIAKENLDRAQEILEENIEETKKHSRVILCDFQMQLGRIYLEKGQIDEAKEIVTKAYKFIKKSNLLRQIAEGSELLGRIYVQINQAKADSYYKIAFDSYNKGGYNLPPAEPPEEEDWYTNLDDV
jgi:tetratricopeptide (TPR) repeat protein